MKKILLGLFLIMFVNGFSQDSCVVKVFPGDCVNCYIGMAGVEGLQSGVKKTIVFPELSKAEINVYLHEVLNITDTSLYNIISSDSIYETLDKNLSSEVYVYNNNKLNNHTLLKEFHGIKEPEPIEIKIPDSIAISQEIIMVNNKKYFFIADSKFGYCLFVNKQQNNKISIVKARNLTTQLNFDKLFGDTIGFNTFSKYRDVLKSANMDKMKFAPTYGEKTMASCIIAPKVIEVEGNQGFAFETGVIVFNSPKSYNIFGIDEKSIPNGYVVYPGFFFKEKDKYYLQVTNIDRDKNNQYLLGKFVLKNNMLVFSEFPEFKIPHEYLPSKKFKSLRKVISPVKPFFFLQFSLSYFDLTSGQVNQLPLDSVNLNFEFNSLGGGKPIFEYDFKFIDALVSERYLRVLYEKSNNLYIATINKSDNSLINNREISNPGRPNKSGVNFYSQDKLYYLTKDNVILVENINYR